MEQLSEFERQSISAIARGDLQRDILLAQLGAASCKSRDYTGVGLYTEICVAFDAPRLNENRWMIEHMPKGHVDHPDLDAGAGQILWVKDGFIVCLESYTYEGAWPQDESLFRFVIPQF
jgi:hypothetical protein